MIALCFALFLISSLLIVYHHALYPLLQRHLTRHLREIDIAVLQARYREMQQAGTLPHITVIVPAFNESAFIAEKIRNLAMLEYPADRLRVQIICDGCSDDTAAIARQAAAEPECRYLQVEVVEHTVNRGKTAVVNEAVAAVGRGLVALSDTSALVSIDALLLAAAHFSDNRVGVVAAGYTLFDAWEESESGYWRYQTAIKQRESLMGSVLGAHGAFYLFRRSLFSPLEADTINDDFVLPMRIVASGHRAVYEPRMRSLEMESGSAEIDINRRRRIAAGNVQQVFRLAGVLSPRHGRVAFNFISGKALRTLMPLCLLCAFACNWALAGLHPLLLAGALAQTAVYAIVLALRLLHIQPRVFPLGPLCYLVNGHFSTALGTINYLTGRERGRWQRASVAHSGADAKQPDYIHPVTRVGKRGFDLLVSACGLLVLAPLLPLIGLLIRLDSRGPVLFRQLRVGRVWPDRVELFWMIKFRTMRIDAESAGKPLWATEGDPRITRVGRFLRKTRLDEIPQLLNVLRGEMSIVGPRPERPGFYARLEQQIPFYAERTYGLLPGITGLAQVNQGYDSCIEDVRSKVGYDHAYALALSRPWSWLKWDLSLSCRTFTVMLFGRGQ